MVELPDGMDRLPGERWLPLSVAVGLLGATAGLVLHGGTSEGGVEQAVAAVLPALLAVRLGWHALRDSGDWDREEVRQVTVWILGGAAVMLLVGFWFGILERGLEVAPSPEIAVVTGVAVGALLGMQVGRYGVRARRKVEEATSARLQREHAERSRERIALLNRIVRHHMRNGVSVIDAAAQLAEEHVDEDGREHLGTIRDRSQDLSDKVETFQRISETLAGATPVGERDLQGDLTAALDRAREEYPSSRFEFDEPADSVEVRANDLLERVLYTQLENAVVHNDGPEPTVTVSVSVGDRDVTVWVADDGPGIPDDEKELVFDAGDRGRTTEGDGLELFLANALVEQYGGSMTVEDNDPRGSVFVTRLPLAGATDDASGPDVVAPDRTSGAVDLGGDREDDGTAPEANTNDDGTAPEANTDDDGEADVEGDPGGTPGGGADVDEGDDPDESTADGGHVDDGAGTSPSDSDKGKPSRR